MAVCLAYSNTWNLPITEEKTFLNVKVLEYEEAMTHGKRQRSSSVPGLLPSFAEENKLWHWFTQDTFQSDQTGALLGPSGPQAHLARHWGSSSLAGTLSGELIDAECDTPTSRTSGKKQRHGPKKTRPCKGKRERVQRLIHRLNSLVDENPEDFNIQAVVLPVCVGDHEELRNKVLKAVQAHRERYVAG